MAVGYAAAWYHPVDRLLDAAGSALGHVHNGNAAVALGDAIRAARQDGSLAVTKRQQATCSLALRPTSPTVRLFAVCWKISRKRRDGRLCLKRPIKR
jgi:hypothetical protein